MTDPFVFPREYHFPPFFTRQTNLTTHHAQLTKWSTLVLSFCQHHRIHKLSLSNFNPSQSAPSSQPTPAPAEDAPPTEALFHNAKINRRLSTEDIREVVGFMRKNGRAEPAGEEGDVVWIYWRRPEEWAASVERWVDETAQRGMVMTVYELTEGETCRGAGEFLPTFLQSADTLPVMEQPLASAMEWESTDGITEFYGLDRELMVKALQVLVKKGKAQIFGQEDSQGVKFF